MPVSRKLVAVVMADVVGYSRLMERDEAGTHVRLRELREKLFDPKIAEHGGRVVKTSGDGMLLEFPSATSAMRCAIEVQHEMAARNDKLSPDERIELRAGINLGDIIVDGDDIVGDGVNVAQRLETLAEPGGICVASAVLEQVREDLGVEFIDAGEQRVKNISRAIRVFRAAGPHVDRSSAPTPVSAATEPTPRSIMVVPFRAPPDDEKLRFFADTLAGDLARILSDTMRDVHVVTVETALDQGKRADDRSKARYLVEGELRASGDDVVIITRSVDAVLSRQIGSDRHTVPRARLASEQERLTLRMMYAIRGHFENAEQRRSSTPLPSNATARDLVDRARALDQAANAEDLGALREARMLYDQAIAHDPSLAAAWAGRAYVGFAQFIADYHADGAKLLAEMESDSVRAIELDPQDPSAWDARTAALQFQSRFDAALAANDRARALDPVHFYFLGGFALIYAGRAAEAVTLIEARSAMLGQTGADLGMDTVVCDAHLHLGNYPEAIVHGERAAAGFNTYWNYLNLTAAYAQVGDTARAAAARVELLRRVPEFTIARFKAKEWSMHPTWIRQTEEHLITGLRKAGVPE